MSILKFVYETPRTLSEMYDYILNPSKTTPELCFSIGVDIKTAVNEMMFAPNLYCTDYEAPYAQIIFSFDENIPTQNLPFYRNISLEIAKNLNHGVHQTFGALHIDKLHQLHAHIIINTTSIYGKQWRQQKNVVYYKKKMNPLLISCGLSPIKVYEHDNP